MKKTFHFKIMSLVAMALLWGSQLQAQVASGYQFSQSNSSFSAPVTGLVGADGLPTTTPMLFPSGWDNNGVQLTLPFEFIFNNVSYSKVTLSSNGYLVFGEHAANTVSGTAAYLSNASGVNNGFAFLGTDLEDTDLFLNSALGYVTSGSNYVSSWIDGVQAGQGISGPGIPAGTIVTQKVEGGFYMSANATQSSGIFPSYLAGSTGVYASVSGTAPNRVYTITTIGASRGNLFERMSFKVELAEANHTLRVVYGDVNATALANVQVGIRTTSADFNARRTSGTHNWATTSASVAAGNTCRLSLGNGPASGLTFQWGPCSNVMPEAVAQSFCQGATVADLEAEGANIQWYTTASGGTALDSATELITGTYYASQTFGVCESDRIAVSVTVTPQSTYYADADGDGYGNPDDSILACEAPEGYVTDNTDCDDSDANVHTTFMFYKDNDNDGYGAGELTPACAVDANTPPAGFSLNDTDCDDSDAGAHMMVAFYADEDGDGQGAGEPVYFCVGEASSVPEGFATNAEDCDDSDETISGLFWFYVDADGDGYGTGDLVEVCAVDADTPPANYSLNNSDCDDSMASVNPGAAEILYNGIDDNCDGQLDEGNQMTTTVAPARCGATLEKIYHSINVNYIHGATQYRFKVLRLGDDPSAVQYIERDVHWFALNMLDTYDYESTYEISCEIQYNGTWLGYYGPTCYVSSPAILESPVAINPTQCGQVMPQIYSSINTAPMTGATGYRFRITDTTNEPHEHTVQIIDRPVAWFNLDMLERYNYGTTYSIEVAIKTTGDYTIYGTPCLVITPALPKLLAYCGTAEEPAIVPKMHSSIQSETKARATMYRFQITNMNTFETVFLDRTAYFTFNQLLEFDPTAVYRVRVAVMTTGSWSEFGDPCYITYGTTAAMRAPEEAKEMFAAVAYPSPFDANFSIGLKAATVEPVKVRIYDMLGKLVEDRTVDGKVMSEARFGERLPSGVFNVVVSQGAEVKTLRVIKR